MKTQLLVPLYTLPEGNSERFALHVAAFAGQANADISTLMHVVTFPNVTNVFGKALVDLPKLLAEAKAACRAEGGKLERAIAAAVAPAGISVTTKEIESYSNTFGDAAAEEARYSDLVLVGMPKGNAALRETAQALLFGSGRPVVVVPEEKAPSTFDRVMVAWDGSRPAARAVLDAMDLLRRAMDVTVVTVEGEKALATKSGARLVDFLGAHGVKARWISVDLEDRPISEVLWNQAILDSSNLVVMGAFGHSRLREFVLGGATRGVLADLRLPVLFSH
jgi:nucleotide-binding universal stress UspA family protein